MSRTNKFSRAVASTNRPLNYNGNSQEARQKREREFSGVNTYTFKVSAQYHRSGINDVVESSDIIPGQSLLEVREFFAIRCTQNIAQEYFRDRKFQKGYDPNPVQTVCDNGERHMVTFKDDSRLLVKSCWLR